MSTEIVKDTQSRTPSEMINIAIANGADLDKLEKLLTLQERWEANEARKIFAKSFAASQEKILSVAKTKNNSQTHSKYADLGDVIESSKPVYTKEGFSIIFYEGDCPKENHIRIFADVLHSYGHKETYHYDVPMDGKGLRGNDNMTAIHGKASSISYGRRYLMCMIWNIPTQDNDGQSIRPVNKISDSKLHIIRDLMISKELTESKLVEFLKVDKLENMLEADYTKAIQAIKATAEKIKKGAV